MAKSGLVFREDLYQDSVVRLANNRLKSDGRSFGFDEGSDEQKKRKS